MADCTPRLWGSRRSCYCGCVRGARGGLTLTLTFNPNPNPHPHPNPNPDPDPNPDPNPNPNQVHVAAAVRARAASPIFLEHTAGGGSLAGRCRGRL